MFSSCKESAEKSPAGHLLNGDVGQKSMVSTVVYGGKSSHTSLAPTQHLYL